MTDSAKRPAPILAAGGIVLRGNTRPRIAVVRIDDTYYAIGDTCSHAEVSLSEGEVICESKEIECWKHGSTFSLIDGKPQSLPATRPVPVYDLRVDGDEVSVVIN